MHDLEHLVDSSGFWVALVVATVGCAVVWVRSREGIPTFGAGFVAAVAGVVGLGIVDQLHVALVVGLALLVGGELIAGDRGWCSRALWLVPGALVVGASLPDGFPFWMRVVGAVVAAVGGATTVATDRAGPRWAPPLFTVGAVGLYFCVPDTETPAVLVGALLVGSLFVFEPKLRASVGVATLTGLFGWVAVYGGVGRAGSVIGGVGCLGVLLLPLVRVAPSRARLLVVLLLVQAALVAYESRVAGAESSGWTALALSLPAFAVAAAVLLVVAGRRATERRRWRR